MTNVLALIPARSGSKGIPHKNFRELAGGPSPVQRAMLCAEEAGCDPIVVSSDLPTGDVSGHGRHRRVRRPATLAQDDTPMIDVVKHALAEISGPDDQIILLVQPTQPLRQPKHLIQAIELLASSGADSVASVVETRSPELILEIFDGQLKRALGWSVSDCPQRRQGAMRGFWLDGTVYAFRRRTVRDWGDIYGSFVKPLIIPAAETCPLDTLEDWHDAERRLRERPTQA